LANPTIEKDYLEEDMKSENIEIHWAPPFLKKNTLFFNVFRMLMRNKYDLIHSQGFSSAFYVSLCNIFFRIPHILTMHGVLEKKYFHGKFAKIKRLIFEKIIKNVTVFHAVEKIIKNVTAFHAVSTDILNHFQSEFPRVKNSGVRWEVIRNGIPSERFFKEQTGAGYELRKRLQIKEDVFLFGYFGRFMPEKGFGYIIKAVRNLKDTGRHSGDFIVLAVGSGDYESKYKKDVEKSQLNEIFHFLPFSPNVDELIKGCDAVLMPSLAEAYGLLACEVLTAGIPIIVSDCMGLREATRETPAVSIPSGDAAALSEAMLRIISQPELKEEFVKFKATAAKLLRITRSRV
jgi:glycosyltransferase involved in cell wall biosynthesis